MNGIFSVDKPAGCTSHDIVGRVRRLVRGVKIGHAGTLDPDATGVLLLCLGTSTRIVELLWDLPKEYRAMLSLGTTTSTEDASGEVLEQVDASGVTEEMLLALRPRFTGEIMQTPPMVSAVHHKGKRLYELAREGVTVERTPRPARIDRIVVENFQSGPSATATLTVTCGRGTYIRTVCADLGAALGVGGHMASLRRTRVGDFTADQAAQLDELSADELRRRLLSPSHVLPHIPCYTMQTDEERAAIGSGKDLKTGLADCLLLFVNDQSMELAALARVTEGVLHPYRVFL